MGPDALVLLSAAGPSGDGGGISLNATTLVFVVSVGGGLVSGLVFLHRSLMASKDREIARVDADRKEQVERLDANRKEEVGVLRDENRRLAALLFEVAERTDRAFDLAGAPKPPPATRRPRRPVGE